MGICYLVDFGATKIATGRVGASAPDRLVPTPADQTSALQILDRYLHELIDPEVVIVAVPGLVTVDGVVTAALHSPIKSVHLRQHLAGATAASVYVGNDAKVQARAFQNASRMHLHITTGTAVGGAIVSEGRVLEGASGFAGEIGHLPVPSIQAVCPCGRRSCLDTIASGWSLERDLGPGWWNRRTADVRHRLFRAGVATGQAITSAGALLDIASYSIAGRLGADQDFVDGLSSLLDRTAVERLPSAGSSWGAASLGAARLLCDGW